jgi:hypothetical protein
MVGRGRLVAGVSDGATVEARSRIVDHPVGADEGLLPGARGDEASVKEESG